MIGEELFVEGTSVLGPHDEKQQAGGKVGEGALQAVEHPTP